MGKFRGLDEDEGWIRRALADLQRQIAEQAAARRLGLQSDVKQYNLDPATLPASWGDMGNLVSVTPPDGYNVALVQMVATAGASYPDNVGCNIGVQPRAGGVNGIGQSTSRPSNSVGFPAISITAGGAFKLAVTPGVPFILGANAYATAGYNANTGNVRLSATIIYTRE